MRGKKRTKCRWCPETFPVQPQDIPKGTNPSRKSRIDHLKTYHRMEGINLSNYSEHFIYVKEPETT